MGKSEILFDYIKGCVNSHETSGPIYYYFCFAEFIVNSLLIIGTPQTLFNMSSLISKRFLCFLNFGRRKLNFLLTFFVFLSVILYHTATAQICDKKTTVFFESDQYAVPSVEEKKLHNLTNQFSQKTDTFLLEIYAFTDSIASVDYNYKLAQNRFKSIVTYLKKNSVAYFEIIEKVRGEAAPLSSNATEEGRAKNRRVEIFYFKISEGLITLKGKGGMEMGVGKDFFAPCGICETNPKLTEIFNNDEAARAGVPLTTIDGCELVSAGMVNLNFNCKERPKRDKDGKVDPKYCQDVIIKMPGSKFDDEMQIWNSTPVDGQGKTMSKWFRESGGQLEYDEKNKMYTLTVKFCPGNTVNLDKIGRFVNTKACLVSDSAGVVALPELIRSRKSRRYRTGYSTILSPEGKKTVTTTKFHYSGKGSVTFADSGMSKEKIGYFFSGNLDNYEMECDSGRCRRLNECWCYEIPLSAYTKIIYFQKKKDFRLKIPRKYRNYSVRLFIPAADSIIPLTNVKGSRRKYNFQQPLPDTYVVLYKENNNPNNKRGYDYQVDLEKIPKKYSKRKEVYKARIKRRQLKHTV